MAILVTAHIDTVEFLVSVAALMPFKYSNFNLSFIPVSGVATEEIRA